MLLLPAWPIVYSRMWKGAGAVPRAALPGDHVRPARERAFGPPLDPAAYDDEELVADALAVLDADGDEKAVLASLSRGNGYALLSAADHPERVLGWVALAPYIFGLGTRTLPGTRPGAWFDDDFGVDEGWYKYNRHSWLRDWPGFAAFFFGELCVEPHSTKLIEDVVDWALGTSRRSSSATEQATLRELPDAERAGCSRPLPRAGDPRDRGPRGSTGCRDDTWPS